MVTPRRRSNPHAAAILERIAAFNRGRDPQRVVRKYALMRSDPFAFFRGTCHLFYEDWATSAPTVFDAAARGWITGDLHLENFGTFRGDNDLTYFDLNDFDEAVLAPATWELARFVTSVLVAAVHLRIEERQALQLARRFLRSYRSTLATGKAGWVERTTAHGVVRQLLRQVRKRSNADLLETRTERHKGKRRIIVNGRRALPCSEEDRERVTASLATVAEDSVAPGFFDVIDVARRVAGTGSLGVPRFVVLVRGEGEPAGNMLLDVKSANASVVAGPARRRGCRQPAWPTEAERVVTVQRRAEAAAPAFLRAVLVEGAPFVLRVLQPLEDRLNLEHLRAKPAHFRSAVKTMGRVTAWGMLRSASRQGAAGLDDWVAWSEQPEWESEVVGYARAYRRTVLRDWRAFSVAHEDDRLPR